MATRTRTIEGTGIARNVEVLNNDVWSDYIYIRQSDAWGNRAVVKLHRSNIEDLFAAINKVTEN